MAHVPRNTPLPAKSRTTNLGPFGEVIRATGPMAKVNPFRFSTKYQDDETDLLYYGYRYYSASTGRWLSRDPIKEKGGLNLYGFVVNNPLSSIDPFGQDVIYILDPNAVGGAGHAAILIGNDKGGWHYFSFGPGKCMINPYGGNKEDNLEYKGFNSLDDARKDSGLSRYKIYEKWSTDDSADKKAIEAVKQYFHKGYGICGQNCDDVAAKGIKAAGVNFDDKWKPVNSYDSNKGGANESGGFPKQTNPATP